MAVTANQLIKARMVDGFLRDAPVAASKRLYEGTLCYINTAGFATDVITGATFGGIVKKEVDNSSGSNGDLTVELYTKGAFQLPFSGAADANRGDEVEGVDNYDTQTLSTGPRVGMFMNAPATGIAEVEIDVQK